MVSMTVLNMGELPDLDPAREGSEVSPLVLFDVCSVT